ncbi:Fur family transcriptional regulator, zinc uptake regulator [Nitratireductor aquibiodomus]|uniref:Fur family transcriptional regulator, zinc uptake regulator n=1 Tax=Nitratireductor aquibiodomus TaxID=204799 RepID=A0A1H4JUF4_9HYPH|nr:Fur family transcriptional regulator [Nitratireductor aquibiodomus]SEB49418.1 Fur family transcriptional regulator, zinc uptake regulator [Nitratireductor aquibiodomus]
MRTVDAHSDSRPNKVQHGRNQKLVLDVLRRADKPLGAYEVLRLLRDDGLRAPLQVYRALERLIAAGAVHRIESVNAYALCSHEHGDTDGHAVFTICTQCGHATELHEPELDRLLSRLACEQQFSTRATMVELSGVCKDCAND